MTDNSIRGLNRAYHRNLYLTKELFKPGSWLAKPETRIIGLVDKYLTGRPRVTVLDLGSGVGRNAIPVARKIRALGGKVICVDILDTAISKLDAYARKYHVASAVTGYCQPVEDFRIEPGGYDFIFSHSVLNQLGTRKILRRVIVDIMTGTKKGGINYLSLVCDLEKTDAATGEKLPQDVEVPLTLEEASKLLHDLYGNWQMIENTTDRYQERYKEADVNLIWKADFLIFSAMKNR